MNFKEFAEEWFEEYAKLNLCSITYKRGILKELKDEQDKEILRLGDKWVEKDRLFVK